MNNKLICFNKEGDSLNLTYDAVNDKYTSTLNFDENSSDTFKTIGLYLFEKVDSIEFDSSDHDTNLQKFQLFNENRITFTGNSYFTQSVSQINSVNLNNTFYSKWINGENFEKKFPIGSSIVFTSPVFEFTTNITYIVVGSKKNAIMIISNLDNVTFDNLYGSATFSNISISGLNSIGIYDYRRGVVDQLSSWNEPTFYNNLYDNKKLTYISGKTQSLLTIKDYTLVDRTYYKYNIDTISYTQSKDLTVNLTLKTDLPTVYSGGLDLVASSNRIYFSNSVPFILKPGVEFVINDSVLNSNALVVDSISAFTGNVVVTYYPTDSQVIWNNFIYQCTQGYTQSLTSSTVPDDGTFWTSSISYLPSSVSLLDESLLNTSIHLTTNKLVYTQAYTTSNAVTMASFAQRYVNDFKSFNINLGYSNAELNLDLIYPSKYAIIDYLSGTTSITNVDEVVEKIIETKEVLKPSIDTNISSNKDYSMVISNIDDFGIKLLINGHIYQESTEYVYNGLNVDQVKTIDRTLRNLLVNNFLRLTSIGIGLSLHSNNYMPEFDFYKDTLEITTEYPNVPLDISVQMGSLASYYIKHSMVSFNDMGSYLNININGIDYGQKVTSTQSVFIPDINTALTNWVSLYKDILFGYGIIVSNIRSYLYFNISEPTTRLKYTIRTNKLATPGIDQYLIHSYLKGNLGTVIAGNEVVLGATSSQNFELSGFSTGMITAINNTVYPYDNQEYNTLYVDSSKLGLSYQGPFWGTYPNECSVSSMRTLAFSTLAYSSTPCGSTSGTGGEFSYTEYSSGFAISFIISNDYNVATASMNNINLKDMLYIDEYSKIYVLGNNISVVDALTLELLTVIPIIGNTSSTKIVYNNFNKYIYAVTNNKLVIIDPITDTIFAEQSLIINDILINQRNGDVYITNSLGVKILYYNSFSPNISLSIPNANKMEYNIVDNYIYVVGNDLFVINTISRTIQTSYVIAGLDSNYIYSEPIFGSIYVWGVTLTKITDGVITTIPITNVGFNKIIYDNFTGDLFISQSDFTAFTRLTTGDSILYTENFGYGDIVVNQFDGDIYMLTPSGRLDVVHASNGTVVYTTDIGSPVSKVIYNPMRNSTIAMVNIGYLYEFAVVINSVVTQAGTSSSPSSLTDGLFGTLASDYVQRENIWLKTREYLRGPRHNYSDDTQVKYIWKFENDQVPNIFMYDISGYQLPTGTSYSYVGPLPLPSPVLNDSPNRDLNKIADSSAQQTIFDEIVNTLEYLDDPNDLSILPTPIELFLGYNSSEEGWEKSVLKMYSREDVSFNISYNISLNNDIQFIDNGTYGIIQMNHNSLESFVYDSNDIKRGLKPGQLLQILLTDISNNRNKYISSNNGLIFKVREIYNTQIVVDYIDNVLINESNIITDYPIDGITTYLKINFTVMDREVISIDLFGQTEIEDIRYKIELGNSGHNIDPTDAYIFKTYDIDEQGIDWQILNKKRKEMIMVRSDIFPYVGSYKAIINAINFFGYNDLLLYEYYRNINLNSPDFFKLFKVEIPDIFDNTVAGWTPNDFIKHTMPNPNFEETNLFNLTYLITDKQGNNVLLYSLQEVLIKLHGLKNWLESKVIPITHRILDITGRTDFVGGNYIRHKSFNLKSFKVQETMTPIDFNINEAYLMPVNSGSTVYNVMLDFVSSKVGVLPANFSLVIRTYKTFLEWNAFTTYNMGDEVIYYGIIYKSLVDTNKILDPRTYDNSPIWNPAVEYFDGAIVNYNRYAYEYLGTQSSFLQFGTVSVPTPAQTNSWLSISNWVQQDLVPVQTINEYRYLDNVTYSTVPTNVLFYTSSVTPDYLTPSPSFNFSVDSNIDPFITIELTSENGYGASYTSKKNYEIRGLNDLFAGVKSIESIGPFVPISPVTIHI